MTIMQDSSVVAEQTQEHCLNVATHRGYLYECGMNMGILHYLENGLTESSRAYCAAFRQRFYERFHAEPDDVANVVAGYLRLSRDTIDHDSVYRFVCAAMLEGESMIRSFIKSRGVLREERNRSAGSTKKRDNFDVDQGKTMFLADEELSLNLELVYFQLGLYQYVCNSMDPRLAEFYEEHFLTSFPGIENCSGYRLNRKSYSETGGFLKADTIVLLRAATTGRYYLFISDESSHTNLFHLPDEEGLYQLFVSQIFAPLSRRSYFRATSITATGSYEGIELNEVLQHVTDKELLKAVQAGSYAYSLLNLLRYVESFGYDGERFQNIELLTICGKSSVDEGVINLPHPGLNDLQMFYSGYLAIKNSEKENGELFFENCAREAYRSIRRYRKRVLTDLNEENGWNVSERIFHNFRQTHLLRKEHSQAILDALCNPTVRTAYLLGNPGIGKTYSFKQYLCRQTDTLSFYLSPRLAINSGFQNEFAEDIRNSGSRTLIVLTDSTHGTKGISVNGDKDAVEEAIQLGSEHGFDIKLSWENDNRNQNTNSPVYDRLSNSDMSVSRRNQETIFGRLEEFLSFLIEAKEYGRIHSISNVCVILSMQACKMPAAALKDRLFGLMRLNVMRQSDSGWNDEDDMEKAVYDLSKAFSRVVTMVDEVSGDSNGIKTSRCFRSVFRDIMEYGSGCVSTCLLVADASMTDKSTTAIYEQGQLGSTMFIGDSGKNLDQNVIVEYVGEDQETAIINCNSFPAVSLKLTMKTATSQTKKADIDAKILTDCLDFVTRRKMLQMDGRQLPEQCIVYIQDKNRLAKIQMELEKILSKEGVKAFTSAVGRKQREDNLNEANNNPDVAVILMTSSAARGISFKRITKTFVAVPTFDTASNLMEIVQLAFRGRGDKVTDAIAGKEIAFYIDLSHEPAENRFRSVFQSKNADKIFRWIARTDAMTMELLLVACLETRIYGADCTSGRVFTPLGRQYDSTLTQSIQYDLQKGVNQLLWNHRGNDNVKRLCTMADNLTEMSFVYPESILDKQILRLAADSKRLQHEEGSPYRPFFVYGGLIIFRVDKPQYDLNGRPIFSVNTKIEKRELVQKKEVEELVQNLMKDYTLSPQEKLSCQNIGEYLGQAIEFADSFRFSEHGNGCYIAYPLLALGNPAFTKGASKWVEMYNGAKDVDSRDVVLLMKGILNTLAPMKYCHPLDGKYGFKDVPYIAFQADDFDHIMKTRYVNSQILASNRTNLLSLIFAQEENEDDENSFQ